MGTGRFRKRILTAVLVSLCGIFVALTPAAVMPVETYAADLVQVKVTPEYRQTMARSMLPIINKWRAGSTWYYNEFNQKQYLSNLKPLTYDYTLEKYAMQRAAELVVAFEHTRPNGGTSTGIKGYKYFAENIAATTNTSGGQAEYGFEMFKEENMLYENQGHRRLMLSVPGNFSNVGIACIYYKGAYYWCQTFAIGDKPDTNVTTALNGSRTMTIDVDKSRVRSGSVDLTEMNNWQANLKKGQTDYLPQVNLYIGLDETWPLAQATVQAAPKWTSANTNVVTINSDAGTITGVGGGSTNVTMSDGITGTTKSKTVTVSDPSAVTGIALNKTSLSLNAGKSETLTATVSPATATNKKVIWSSSDTSVATVSSTGTVTGVKAGTATITARTENGGKTATCKVAVTQVGVSMSATTMNLPAGSTGKLTASVTPSSVTNKALTWKSSNNAIATVDQNGNITAKAPGRVTITATPQAGGADGTCEVRVQFKDVTQTTDWFYKAVYWAADLGITTGTNGYFSPAANCTREQAVTFLWRMAGKPEPKSMTSKFSDVTNASSYSYKAIMWAAENGITTGTNGKFFPTGTCTREQIMTFLWRLAGKPEPKSMTSKFSDVTNRSSYSYKAILWGAEQGITTGTNGKFSPTGLCLRREIVTFLYRYSNIKK